MIVAAREGLNCVQKHAAYKCRIVRRVSTNPNLQQISWRNANKVPTDFHVADYCVTSCVQAAMHELLKRPNQRLSLTWGRCQIKLG